MSPNLEASNLLLEISKDRNIKSTLIWTESVHLLRLQEDKASLTGASGQRKYVRDVRQVMWLSGVLTRGQKKPAKALRRERNMDATATTSADRKNHHLQILSVTRPLQRYREDSFSFAWSLYFLNQFPATNNLKRLKMNLFVRLSDCDVNFMI